MATVDYGVSFTVNAKLESDIVTAFVGTGPYPADEYECRCPGSYLLTLPITPRPPDFRNRLGEGMAVRETRVGEMMFIPAGHTQRGTFRAQQGKRQDIFCLFPDETFERLMSTRVEWDAAALAAAVDLRDSQIYAAARRLAQEAMHPGLASRILADSIATSIAIDIGRYFGAPSRRDMRQSGRLTHYQLRRIMEYVHDNPERDITLAQIAGECRISVRQLTRAFKETTGRTVFQFVADTRLEIAKQLLRDTMLPPKVIAARVGFANVSSFATAFRRHAGLTPGEFRSEDKGFPRYC